MKHTKLYSDTLACRSTVNALEANDCAVIAISIATGVSYADAHAALKRQGRADGKGTYRRWAFDALNELGFRMVRVGFDSLFDKIPVKVKAKHITSSTARRFPQVFDGMAPILMWTETHVLCIKDNEVHDWSNNKSLRARKIDMIVPARLLLN